MREAGDRTVLVTGATGTIGPALVHALVRDGFAVRALVRHPDAAALLPSSVQIVAGDIADQRSLRQATAGVDVIYHLAAKLHKDVSNADLETRAEYERVNATATRELARCGADCGVRRFIYFSSIAVYGPTRDGEIFDESSAADDPSLYAATKRRGEEAALLAPGSVVLRLAAVYGPRMKGNYRTLARAIQRGWFLPIGSGENRRTLVHEQDVVRAAMIAAAQAPSQSIYNVTDGRIHTVQEILAAMSAVLDRPMSPVHLPVAPIRATARFAHGLCRVIGLRSPLSPAMVDKWLEDVAVSGKRFQTELRFVPAFDLLTGWRQALSAPRPADPLVARSTA